MASTTLIHPFGLLKAGKRRLNAPRAEAMVHFGPRSIRHPFGLAAKAFENMAPDVNPFPLGGVIHP